MQTIKLGRAAARLGIAAGLFLAGALASAQAQTCPDVSGSGRALSYSAGDLVGGGQTANVMAGGNIDLGNCDTVPGYGWIIENPDFELFLTAMPAGQSLTISVDGSCDTVLLVNDSRGAWHFNDDAGGTLDPSMTLPGASDGVFDIWVGTFGTTTCPATLELRASGTSVAPPPPPSAVNTRYDVPRVRGELVDWCVTWGADCGQGGADNFCRSQGHDRAISWERYPGQRTLVLGDDRICPGGCDALRDVVCTGRAAPPPPPSVTQTFPVPRVRGEIVDWCVTWATDCGQGGADNFCRSQGFARATDWERYPGQRTLVLGDDRICPGGCDGLRNVVCTGAGAPPPPPTRRQTFAVPRVNGEIVDWCVTWATNCGQGGADNFCRSQGYARADSWQRFPGQRTLVLGDNRICPGGCDGLRDVVCMD